MWFFWFKDLRFWSFERFGVFGLGYLRFWGFRGFWNFGVILGFWAFLEIWVLGFLDLYFEVFCWFMVWFWGFRMLGLGVFGFWEFLY